MWRTIDWHCFGGGEGRLLGNAIARRWAPQNGHERRDFSRRFGPRTARPPPPRFGPKTPKIARSARARSHENFGDKTLANFFFSAPTFFTRICRANFFFASSTKRKNSFFVPQGAGGSGSTGETCHSHQHSSGHPLADFPPCH